MRRLIQVACLLAMGLAYGGNFEVVIFENALFNMPNPVQEVDVVFPDDGRTYSAVNLVLTLEPPDGLDGDEWDRMGHIYMYDEDGEFTELARFITPFWNPPWTWTLDITETQLLFMGDKRVGVWLQSWKDDGYQLDLSIEFTEGAPAQLSTNVANLWHGPAFGYGNTDNFRMEKFFFPFTVPTSPSADTVLSRISVTGHRFVDNTNNAAEFLRAGRVLNVNGGGGWFNELWQECGSWPVQPQSPGTWQFDRSGWCPGDLVDAWIVDVTSQVTPGQDILVEYIADEYINAGPAQDATEYVGGQIVELRDTDTSIWRPTENINLCGVTGSELEGRSKTLQIHNFNGAGANYTASSSASWLTVSGGNVFLNAGQNAVMTMAVNSGVQNLGPGTHTATVTLTDTTNGVSEQRAFTLELEEPGLVAHWKLDETSGTTANDSSGNGYHGNLEGGISFDANSVIGAEGTALNFDGVDDLVDAGNVPLKGSFSVALWALPQDLANVAGFLHKWDRSSQQFLKHSFWIGPDWTDGAMRFVVYPSIYGKGMVTTDTILAIDSWVHVAATFDGTNQRVYVNGVLTDTGPERMNGLPGIDGTLYMGRRNNADWFNGALDDVRIYNYALSDNEVHWLLCPLDLNVDGTVDATDLGIAMADWPVGPLLRDANDDGDHNILDLLAMPDEYGSCQ